MLYILHGPDDFSRAEKIAELKSALGDPTTADMNTSVLDGRGLTLGDIRREADAMPFLSPRRLVVVNNYLAFLGNDRQALQTLTDYLQNLAPTTDLVLSETETLPARHPVLKTASAVGATVIRYGDLDRASLHTWIMKRAEALDGRIQPDAAELLARLVGPDLHALSLELEKLLLYTGFARPVAVQDVQLLTPYTEDAEEFGMSNAIGRRDARRAYDQLHKALEEGKPPAAILGSIMAQIRALIEVKDMAEQGMSAQEIARAKGWRSDYAAKMRLREAANFSMARLEQIMDLLLETDLAVKTGKMDYPLALDTLIARLVQ